MFALIAPPVQAQTQMELNANACAAYQEADAELNAVYKRIFAEYKDDAVFLGKLRTAQRAWIAYRDAHLEARFPEPNKQQAYGSIYQTCSCDVLRDVTAQRTATLRAWLDGAEEGDTCSGSIRIKP
ncbi:MAG: DUF1311 domain-containing protein [Rhodospirillales bacterium]|nr:DUF1311 domain-containing protein [Rhodospirillales bacterium]